MFPRFKPLRSNWLVKNLFLTLDSENTFHFNVLFHNTQSVDALASMCACTERDRLRFKRFPSLDHIPPFAKGYSHAVRLIVTSKWKYDALGDSFVFMFVL